MRINLCVALLVAAALCGRTLADEGWKPIVRQLPPPGIAIAAVDRARLETELRNLDARIAEFKRSAPSEDRLRVLPDVEIYSKALSCALANDEFYQPRDVIAAGEMLRTANHRLDEMFSDKYLWPRSPGLVVQGYRSFVDDSVQPFGLLIPEDLEQAGKIPLYVWLHGRNDKLCDLQFIDERSRQKGQVAPGDAIVLHPFGRSCLGWKSTAEIDVLEAIEAVTQRYPIDPDRVVLMGFSMGGAGAWHLGAHYADRWAGVHAGAGFVDVARYQHLDRSQYPVWYEQKLWNVYDVPSYVRNLFNIPLLAYSGELDKQKDAADFMAEVFQSHGRTLPHLIGPGMGHKYAEASWREVMDRMRAAVKQGRDRNPRAISLQTPTLRYHKYCWIEALALEEHWRDSRIDAAYGENDALKVTTKNITAFRMDPPFNLKSLSIDDQAIDVRSFKMENGQQAVTFERRDGEWNSALSPVDEKPLRKQPALQGPIDDAFLDRFLVVLPNGKCRDPLIERWTKFELDHFRHRWRSVYRGRLREKLDIDVTADDIERYHLIAWGDTESNAIIRKTIDKLPIRWNDKALEVGKRNFDPTHHVPIMIYPNPLNAARYVVLNSGPTHREAHDRTNSLQNPKLPDWAIVDTTIAPDAERPGRVVAADFFDEQWQLRTADLAAEQ